MDTQCTMDKMGPLVCVNIVMALIPCFVSYQMNNFIDLKTDYLSTDKKTLCNSVMSQVCCLPHSCSIVLISLAPQIPCALCRFLNLEAGVDDDNGLNGGEEDNDFSLFNDPSDYFSIVLRFI